MKRFLLTFAAALCALAPIHAAEPTVSLPPQAQTMDLSAAEGIAVLSGGRVKPLLVAATEGIQEIRGRAGLTREMGPMRSWFALALFPDTLANQKIVFCAFRPLREDIGLDPTGQFASFAELAGNEKLHKLADVASAKQSQKERLTPVEKAAGEVARRLEKFAEATSASGWHLMIGPKGKEAAWRLPQEIPLQEAVSNPALQKRMETFTAMAVSFQTGNQEGFDQAAAQLAKNDLLADSLSSLGDGTVQRARQSHMHAELALVKFRPFRIAWIALLLAFLAAWIGESAISRSPDAAKKATWASAIAALGALALLVVGFALRIYVSGRPPVTNMYETTLWVGFGAVLFGLPIAWIYRSRTILAAVSAAGWIVFVLADNLPTVLDPTIHPLVPVLRNNFWLTIHVLTVTISYAAFLVAMAIGNVGIFQEFRGGSETFRKTLAHYAYRSMQLGVVLLTSGIVLGGVWADYSWGRFWGWDPKETWSLIADLGYLMVLHGRFTGWIRTFGTLMGAVVAFFGVVMAWYGVNFILASGLHSYGFSEGGAWAMGTFVALQGAFAVVCWIRRRQNLSKASV